MFNQILKFKFYDGRFSRVASFPSGSVSNFFLLQFNHFSSAATNAIEPNSKPPNAESFSAAYLENNFGFSPKRALIISKHMKFDSPEKPLAIIAFLKNQEFTDSDISRFAKKWPYVFGRLPESLLPKIEFFRGLGFSSSELVKILKLQPNLLGRSLEYQIIPCVDFLRSFLASDKDVLVSIMHYPGIFREKLHKTLLPNVEIMRGAGVPDSHIACLLKRNSRLIALDPEGFKSTVQEILNLGFNPKTRCFILGIKAMRSLSSLSWKEKIVFYTRWGWSEHQVLVAIRKNPLIMGISKDKITKTMDFIIKEMGCDVSVFMTRPNLLMLSFDKRIAPRCAFYQVLLSKGLVKGSTLGQMLACSRSSYFEKYVKCFGEKDPEILKLYKEIFSELKA